MMLYAIYGKESVNYICIQSNPNGVLRMCLLNLKCAKAD